MCKGTNGLFSEILDSTRVQILPCVPVFTKLSLHGLFALSMRGSVDGTFSCMTFLWTQSFVLLCKYRGSYIPVGWLPDGMPIIIDPSSPSWLLVSTYYTLAILRI